MNDSKARLILGLGLLLLGIMFLLQNLSVFPGLGELIWGLLFGVGGMVFLGVYASTREQWWALIPGAALLGIALVIILGALFPTWGPTIGGMVFLGVLGASFLAVYAFHRANWWAIIPAGVLLTLAVVSVAGQLFMDIQTGAILFLGLAATFGVLAVIETPQGRMRWALIPAGLLLAIGLMMVLQTLTWAVWLLALLFIAGGGYLIVRSLPRAE